MAWRNHENHKEETKAVKEALSRAGINAVVGHGRGTAWGWLEINIGRGPFSNYSEMVNRVTKIAQEVTGRHGDYSGEILVLTQDHWDRKLNKSVPIVQPPQPPQPGSPEYEALKAKIAELEANNPALANNSAADVAPRLRKLAEGMEEKINHLKRPMTQNATPKRMKEYRSRLHEGDNMERTQKALFALASAHESGNIPQELAMLRTKAEIAPLVHKGLQSCGGYYDVIPSLEYRDQSHTAKLLQAMIDGRETTADKQERERISQISQLEADIQFRKIPGFFPTPRPVIDKMLDEASICSGNRVLEPSAGKGDILDAIRARNPEAILSGIELNHTLAKICRLKGHEVNQSDFLEETGKYDRIVMNPPFENGQDMQHIRHAFSLLKPYGRVVAIVSEGAFFRQDRKATEFREWLETKSATHEQLNSAFSGSDAFRQTGVNARIVVIDADDAPTEAIEEFQLTAE